MPTNVLMPKTGADETHGKLIKWLKNEGDQVSRGDVVAEIETDKVNMEVESFGAGTLYRILVHEGESQEVGKPIAILLKEGEQPPAGVEAKPAGPAKAAAGAPAGLTSLSGDVQTSGRAAASGGQLNGLSGRVKASPLARKIAGSHDLDLSLIVGRGPGGRVVKSDVEEALAAAVQVPSAAPSAPPAFEPPVRPAAQASYEPEPEPVGAGASEKSLTRVQLTAAKRMTESKQTAPHFYLTVDVDMAECMKLRADLNEQAAGSVKVSVNDMVVKAAAWALQRHPELNGSYRDGKLVLHDHINISVAVALEDGLVSPIIPDVDRKSLGQIARETKAMVDRARAGKLRGEDYADGTFTISNLGMFGIDTFVAIINPPQAGILAVGAIREVPVVRDGQIAIGSIMKVTLSADHRATDGVRGAQFLSDVRAALEKPLLMAL